jgi:D-glycero-D-manno-heptose 1,7-bisphosphate phosphatase
MPTSDAALLKEPAEIALMQPCKRSRPRPRPQFEQGDYTASLQTLAALRAPVDAFFDSVMVNADELDPRLNRQGLLASLAQAMNRVADLSRLAFDLSGRSHHHPGEAMKLVILDRDGTINHDSEDYIKSPEEWVPLPGTLEAIAKLNHAGWHVVVATNQSGLGRGLFDVSALNAMHAKMHRMLAAVGGRVDSVFYCPHAPAQGCHCRKPEPGLFEQIGERYGVDLKGVPAVGDTAPRRAGWCGGRVRASSCDDRQGRGFAWAKPALDFSARDAGA